MSEIIKENDELLTIKEVSKLLDCSSQHVYDLFECKEINGFRIGKGTIRIRRSDVTIFLNNSLNIKV